jgi:hypothetical protein
MHAEITAAPAAPCIATGGDRIFSGACLQCAAFAIGCFPANPAEAAGDQEPPAIIPTDDLKALRRDCAGSPCLCTGEARIFSGACLRCPAFALWCFPPVQAAGAAVEPSAS